MYLLITTHNQINFIFNKITFRIKFIRINLYRIKRGSGSTNYLLVLIYLSLRFLLLVINNILVFNLLKNIFKRILI